MFEFIKNIFRRKETIMEDISKKELEYIIQNHLSSDNLKNMKLGDDYYNGKHDILKRKIYGLSGNNDKVELENVPNYKIVDNQFQGILDQKVNYLFAKTPSITTADDNYNNELLNIFNQEFFKALFLLGKNAYKYGIAWLYVYYDNKSKLSFKMFDSKEIIPIWKDIEHNELDKVIRLYTTKEFNGTEYINKSNVEVYTSQGIESYELKNGKLELREELKSYLTMNDKDYSWEKLPIIAFKSSELEQGLILKAKELQDNINEVISDFKNSLSENTRNTVLVVKNYMGEKDTLRHNLNVYGYIGIQGDGDVSTLQVEVNSQNYESLLKILKKSLYENCKGIDVKSDVLKNNPNQMNIQSMYSDIDLDANGIEREFKHSLDKLIWFIDKHIMLKTNKDYSDVDVEIVFNRDILINESQAIDDCIKSLGILSKESVIAQHPWVNNVELELDRLKESEEELDGYQELEQNE